MKKIIYFCVVVNSLIACNSSESSNTTTLTPDDSLKNLLRVIRDSIQQFPEEPRLKYNLAVVLQDAGRYEEALSALDSMTVAKEEDPRVYYSYLYKRSELQELAHDTIGAIESLEKLVQPGEITKASLRLSNLYALTRNEKVLPLLSVMEKTDTLKDVAEINYFRGVYFSEKKEYNKAIEEFDRSIKKSYTYLSSYLEKGIALYKLKAYKKAIAVFDLAITVSNTYPDAFYWKGRCEEALGQTQEARLDYQRAYGLDKTFTEAKEAADSMQN